MGSRFGCRPDQSAEELSDRGEKGERLPPVRTKVSALGPRSLYARIQSRIVECRRPVSFDQPNALQFRATS
jgi:hypothetical protein